MLKKGRLARLELDIEQPDFGSSQGLEYCLIFKMSNERNSGCLVYIGGYTTQLYRDCNKTIIRIPINQPVQWKVRGFFSWLRCLLGTMLLKRSGMVAIG